MKEQVLTIEQMQHLKELGVDTSKASMVLIYTDDEDNILDWEEVRDTFEHPEVFEHFYDAETGNYDHSYRKDCGVFTLQDIIDLLPGYIESYVCDKYYLIIEQLSKDEEKEWNIRYSSSDFSSIKAQFASLSIIDAAYEMLCWCIENGYKDACAIREDLYPNDQAPTVEEYTKVGTGEIIKFIKGGFWNKDQFLITDDKTDEFIKVSIYCCKRIKD